MLVVAWLAARTLSRVAAAWPFATDDAYITLRYARHLLAGEGLVWNLGGERVEGYSNFAYVLLAALFGALGELDIGPLKLLGVAGLLATGYLQWAIARRFVRPLPALLPFAIYTLERGSVWWSVSGLETGVYVALGCGVVLATLRGLGFARVELADDAHVGVNRAPLAPNWLALSGVLCLLASLLRPEGPIFALAVGAALLVQRSIDGPREHANYRRTAWAFALAFGPALALYLGWRYAYFGDLLPNTVRCKTDHHDRFVLLRAYWSAAPIVLLVALIHPLRSLDARVVLPLTVALAYALALIGADPVVGHDIRHFLAAHALLCVLASVAGVRLLDILAPGLNARTTELGAGVRAGGVALGAGAEGVAWREVAERLGGEQQRDDQRELGSAGVQAGRDDAEQAHGGDAGEHAEQRVRGQEVADVVTDDRIGADQRERIGERDGEREDHAGVERSQRVDQGDEQHDRGSRPVGAQEHEAVVMVRLAADRVGQQVAEVRVAPAEVERERWTEGEREGPRGAAVIRGRVTTVERSLDEQRCADGQREDRALGSQQAGEQAQDTAQREPGRRDRSASDPDVR
ncbi:MAG TPA: hypothetical protein VM869_18150, partial [Enhygromyxa sp.]|nr:hypothetical protein [Enhygromyxa sp.]